MDPAEIWRTIKSLSGTPASQSPNEAIISNGKAITTNAKKAELFAKHYAKVSKLEFSEEERCRNRELKRAMVNTPVREEDKECCKPFSTEELMSAIKTMKGKGAPGPDDIPPSFIKNLGPKALQELLEICNESFLTGEVPTAWKRAIIIPLLKSGKPASQIASFRPISLTSCLMKTLERMVVNRLYYMAETRGWLTSAQAGFRKQRSCEDQILRLTQGVSDSFQRGKRTLMVLIDYSKAYDRVWQEELMLGMLEKGVPIQFMRWIRSFLSVRTAQVLYNGAYSSVVFLIQGLPQGSVISPLLFLFYIDGLATAIPVEVLIAMFADDAAIWVHDKCLRSASKKIQAALVAIAEWSRSKKMEINASKSEATFFTNDSKEAKWRPELTLNNTPVPFNGSPRFLGVHLDRTLSFMDHTVYVADKVSSRCRILASLASKTWGWRKDSLRSVYLTVQRSIMDYAAPAWQPYLSRTRMNMLEVAQNQCLRLINGQYASTPLEALRIEAGVQSYATVSKQHCSIAREKALRVKEDHPRALALAADSAPTHRLKGKSSWRVEAVKNIAHLQLDQLPREPLPNPFIQPWKSDADLGVWRTLPYLPTTESSPSESLAATAIRAIDNIQAETVIYTDGSCKAGTEYGGASAVVTQGPANNPRVVTIIKEKGRRITSSYEEEKAALGLALTWVNENPQPHVAVCSDSQSLLKAIEGASVDTGAIRGGLDKLKTKMTLQWVPGHEDVPGNELADQAAKEATTMEGTEQPISYSSAKALIKRNIKDQNPSHPLVKETYKGHSLKKDKVIPTRKEAALIAQLRSGHCLKLAAYRLRIGKDTSDLCPHCQEAAEDTKHWLQDCPATSEIRMRIFGRCDPPLGTLSTNISGVLEYASRTLL